MKLATLCYIRHKGKTLMLHRIKKKNDMHQGKWNGLGGKLEPGETPEECVIREVREESGLIIKSPVMKGFLTFPGFDGFDDWYVFVYVVDNFEGEMIDSNEGVLKWIPDGDLEKLEVWEGDRMFMKWILQPHFFSAKFLYEKGRLRSHQVVFYD
jgi:8-oxo-dGTP diphosphatase